jgi:hypothetical protein
LQVPVRVAGGLLFELTGQSVGDPLGEEEDVPVVFRSWQSQNFLITSMHVKGMVSTLNVLGVLEVQVHPPTPSTLPFQWTTSEVFLLFI